MKLHIVDTDEVVLQYLTVGTKIPNLIEQAGTCAAYDVHALICRDAALLCALVLHDG